MNGEQLIKQERERQITKEGFSEKNDDKYTKGQLVDAGDAYLLTKNGSKSPVPKFWPWDKKFWKPSNDKVVNLVKSGALYQAEIDRIKRNGINDKESIEWLKLQIVEIAIKINDLIPDEDEV